ncbi:MAG TPA: hypothetical protein VIM75_14505 [Ohtaekwangia sp.]|uniref:hypothetical protein n=1 Tax=Ohtaekwangia sp. TaxID=2066019 RepID=UPI002F944570
MTHHTKSGIFQIDLVTGIYLHTELYYDFMPLDNIQEAGKILCAIDTVIPLKPDFSGIANIKKNVNGLCRNQSVALRDEAFLPIAALRSIDLFRMQY